MSADETKAAACAAQCVYGIIDPQFQELTGVVPTIVANGLSDDDQNADIIDLYTEFDKEVKRRKRRDKEALGKLKTILGLDT